MYNQNLSRSTSKLESISSLSSPSSRGNNNSHYSSLTSPSKSHHNHSYHGFGSGTDPRRYANVSVHQTGTPNSSSSHFSSSLSSSKILSPRRSSRSSGTDSSREGSRSSSPMDMSIDSLQSVSSAYNLVMDGRTSPNFNLYDSRSSSTTSVRSLMRDRSLERNSDNEKSPSGGLPDGGRYLFGIPGSRDLAPTSSASVRERRSSNQQQSSPSSSSKDRSLDREYPHMGARSLERDYSSYHHRRTAERVADTLPSPQSSMELRLKDQFIFELQNQIADLNQDCLKFQRDVETANEKLSSCMNSIKTFWSPELKKERALRKEESIKSNSLVEELKVTQAELKRQISLGKEFQSQFDQSRQSISSSSSLSEPEMDNLRQEQDKQGKEILILRKTVEEMEIRIATQKQTLSARDESIKKLLEMLQSKGLGVKQLDSDRVEIETLRNIALEEEKKRKQLELVLEDKTKDVAKMKEENGILSNQLKNAQFQMKSLPSNSHSLQAMLEAKDSRISALEKDIQFLEDKLLTLQEDISMGDKSWKLDSSCSKESKSSGADTRVLKAKIDRLNESIGRKDTELCGLRLQVDTLEKQYSEQQEYILVLKEQISAREKQTSIIGSEVDELRNRMKDKDSTIERKSKQTQIAQKEKKKFEAELADLRDHLDIKERKVNVLQRKIQTLEDEVADKEVQLKNTQSRLTTLTADSTDSALSSMEESLSDKERLIERLRDQRERLERELTEENNVLQEQNKNYIKQIDALNLEISDKQTQLCELREEAAELHSQKLMSDSMVNQLKMEMTDNSKETEIEKLKEELKKLKEELANASETADSQNTTNSEDIDFYKEEIRKSETQMESLRQQIKDMEGENNNKDATIKDLQDNLKEYKQKMGTLKRNQQTEKKKNAQMLEEARKREVLMDGDASQLKSIMRQRDDRVEELEEALRESVKITAEREMVMAEQESKIQQTEMKVYELTAELEKMNTVQSDHITKVGALTRQLEEKDSKLRRLQSERHRQLEEVYEMKQEAIQAAISEKDANIALLEMTSSKKQRNTEEISRLEKEKEKLALQLKELSETRMRLIQKKNDHTSGSQRSLVHRMKGATNEQVIRAVRKIEHSKKRLRTLIDQLLAAVLDTDPQLLEGLPRIQQGPSVSVATLRTLSSEEIRLELHKSDQDCQKLQDYANILLQRVGASCPELLDNFVSMMESSDTESCQST